jgi:hypothetical protein
MMHKKRLIMYGKLQKVSKDFFFPKISMVDTGKADIVVGGVWMDLALISHQAIQSFIKYDSIKVTHAHPIVFFTLLNEVKHPKLKMSSSRK